jgi:uncharacterized membrane protein YfcA
MLVGVMAGGLVNAVSPAYVLSSVMVAVFAAATLDMAFSYRRLRRREKERDALLKRLEQHVAHEQEEQERVGAEAATADDDDDDDCRDQQQADDGLVVPPPPPHAPSPRPAYRHSLELAGSSGAASSLTPEELDADLRRLLKLAREIAGSEARALNPAMLDHTLDAELSAAFREDTQQQQRPRRRSSDDRGAASLDPQHSLTLVIEEEDGEQDGEDGGDATSSSMLARRIVMLKHEHDHNHDCAVQAQAARVVREAALRDGRYHTAVRSRRGTGRQSSVARAESTLAEMRSARSASNVFSLPAAGGSEGARAPAVVGGGAGGAGSAAASTAAQIVAAAAARRVGGGGASSRMLSFSRVPSSGPSSSAGSESLLAPTAAGMRVPSAAARSAPSDSRSAPALSSFSHAAAPETARPSPFARFSGGWASSLRRHSSSEAGGGSGGAAGADAGSRSAHSDVLAVSPWVAHDDGGDAGARDQSGTAKAGGVWGKAKRAADDDGRTAAWIIEEDGEESGGARTSGGDAGDGCLASWFRRRSSASADASAAADAESPPQPPGCRARFRAWWDLLPLFEAAIATTSFIAFSAYKAMETALRQHPENTAGPCSPRSVALRLALVTFSLALTLLAAVHAARRSAEKRGEAATTADDNSKGGVKTSTQSAPFALGKHEAAVAWSPGLIAATVPLSLIIGAVGGAIGASGVVLSSALLLRLGCHPQVVAADSKVALLTSVAATTLSLAAAGRLLPTWAGAGAIVTLLATPLGQAAADRLISRLGRPSLIVATNLARFAVGVAAVVAVGLVPALKALKRGDASSRFAPLCFAAV